MYVGILTAFPDMFEGPLAEGMIRVAREGGQLEVSTIEYRRFTTDRHRTIDDAPFGGGAGMILKPEPIRDGLLEADREAGGRCHRLLLGPQGERLDQALVRELVDEPRLALISGRYKDVDDRVRGLVDREVSIGDYILSGGELAAMVLVDVVARLLPGVVGDDESVNTDSFERGTLDAPYYTRPAVFEGREVPGVLRSGHHAEIERWRRKEALKRTLLWRPDLLRGGEASKDDLSLLDEIERDIAALIREVKAAREERD